MRSAYPLAPVRVDRIGGQPATHAPLREIGAHVGVERVHHHRVRAEHVAGALRFRQRVAIDEQRARRHLLHVQHRADLAGDLRLDVVALVEHERDVAAVVVAAAAHDLEQDAEQLERIGGADDQVVVRVEARVEVERPEPAEPQQLHDDELDVRARRVVAGVEAHDGALAERDAVHVRRAPVGHVGRVERGLEELVLEHEPLVRRRGARRPAASESASRSCRSRRSPWPG